MVSVIVLRDFATGDSNGKVSGRRGQVIEVKETTAKRLIKDGLVKKYRPKDKED